MMSYYQQQPDYEGMLRSLSNTDLDMLSQCCLGPSRPSERSMIISRIHALLASRNCPQYCRDMLSQFYSKILQPPYPSFNHQTQPYAPQQQQTYPYANSTRHPDQQQSSILRHTGSFQVNNNATAQQNNSLINLLSRNQQNGVQQTASRTTSLQSSSRHLTSSTASPSSSQTERRRSPPRTRATDTFTGPFTAGKMIGRRMELESLPFYEHNATLVRPIALPYQNEGRRNEFCFRFQLSGKQAQMIAMSRDVRRKPEYVVQVLIRFSKLILDVEQKDHLPACIGLKVNGRMASLPPALPTNKPEADPVRPGLPINITPICKISPTVPNIVDVTYKGTNNLQHSVSIYLVRKLTSETLLERLQREKGVTNPSHTREIIKDKLSHDADIKLDSLRVSLQCPLVRTRMVTPCRSTQCEHIQCFDGMNYLMMNERKPKWICPVCDKTCRYEELMIDGLFLAILQKVPDADEISIKADGSWHPANNPDELHHIASPTKQFAEFPPFPKREAHSVDRKPPNPRPTDSPKSLEPPLKKVKSSSEMSVVEEEFIDLTSDDEEDSGRTRKSRYGGGNGSRGNSTSRR